MEDISREDVLKLLRHFGLRKRRALIDPNQLFCPMCKQKADSYVYSVAPNYFAYIADLRQKLYGGRAIFCSKPCFIKFVQEHASDILMAMIKDENSR